MDTSKQIFVIKLPVADDCNLSIIDIYLITALFEFQFVWLNSLDFVYPLSQWIYGIFFNATSLNFSNRDIKLLLFPSSILIFRMSDELYGHILATVN